MIMNMKYKIIKFSRILKKRNISEPFNSIMFILLKIYRYDLVSLKYFRSSLFPKLRRTKIKRILYPNFLHFILKRLNHFPIQYIIGKWYFRNIIVECKPPVLIPRIETEQIIDLSIKNISNLLSKRKNLNSKKLFANKVNINTNNMQHESLKFLEIGVGTGAIFISILKEICDNKKNRKLNKNLFALANSIECVGIDIEPRCIELSSRNVERIFKTTIEDSNNDSNNSRDYLLIDSHVKIRIIKCDFNKFPPITTSDAQKFDFIISNPPYIKTTADNVMTDVSKHESHLALFSGQDGLDLIRMIIRRSRDLVKEGGFVILEIDPGQTSKLIDILLSDKYTNFYFEKDLFGIDRFLIYYVN